MHDHRWKAAKIAGMVEIPCVVTEYDEDVQMAQTIRMNVLRGKTDPSKFTELWLQLVAKYGEEKLRKMMGLGQRDALFRQLLKQAKKGLPEEAQAAIERRADKIRNVEDLAAVVNGIYAQFGATLDRNYMVFSFQGKSHLMIRMNETSFAMVKALMERCREEGQDVNDEVIRRLT